MIVSLSVVHGRAPEPGITTIASRKTIDDCTALTTCERCTDARCVWSNKNQTCVRIKDATAALTGGLVVHDGTACPKFSVEFSERDGNVNVTVTISAEQSAFIGLLNGANKKLQCHLNNIKYAYNSITIHDNRIACHWRREIRTEELSHYDPIYVTASYFWLEFDGNPLRFNNARDHYVVTEPKPKCANDSCVDCLWEDKNNRYYCIWCPETETCGNAYHHCIVRNLRDFSSTKKTKVMMIDSQCSAARIDRFEQNDDCNTVRITMHDHRILLSYRNKNEINDLIANVAGHNCIDLKYENDTIECTISPNANVTTDRGPVCLTLPELPQHLMLQSSRDFDFVNRHFKPNDDQSPTKIKADPPVIDANQTFVGIKSGGYEFWVRGQNLTSLQNVSVHADDKTVHHASCSVKNDTHMMCWPLTTKVDVKDVYQLSVYFEAVHFGKTVNLSLPSSRPVYSLYPDPIFTDFTVYDCCDVTINGVDLDRGYTITNLSIQWDENSSECQIIELELRRIVCQLPSTPQSPPLQTIVITIGNFTTKISNLKKYNNRSNSSARSSSQSNGVDYLPSVFAIGAYVSFIVFLCVILVRLKSSKNYDLLNVHLYQPSTEMKVYDDDRKCGVETEPLNGLRHIINDIGEDNGTSEITKR